MKNCGKNHFFDENVPKMPASFFSCFKNANSEFLPVFVKVHEKLRKKISLDETVPKMPTGFFSCFKNANFEFLPVFVKVHEKLRKKLFF